MKKRLFILLMLSVLSSPSRADHHSISSGPLHLKDVLEAARRDNPEIRAAKKRLEAARARITQESSLEDPRVDIERMYAPRDKDPIASAEERNVAVSQEVPFPTTLYLRSKGAKKEALMQEAAYRSKEQEILSQVRSVYAMLSLSHHHFAILQENTGLMKRMTRSIESRYAAGRAAQGEVLKAQVELARMLNMQITMKQEIETNQAMLNMLLNRDPQSPLGLPELLQPAEFKWKLEELTKLALSESPMLAESAAAVAKNRVDLRLAQSSYLPDFMVTYRRRNMRMEADSHDAMLGFTVPLWFWKQGAMVREARAELGMAEAENDAARNMTRFQVKNLLVKLEANLRLVELYDSSMIPQARQMLRATESAFQANKMEFMDLVDANRTLLTFHEEYYQALAQSEQTLAELERLVGSDITTTKEQEAQK